MNPRPIHKSDVKQQFPLLYRVSAREVVEVKVPPLRYLMIDGMGDPNESPEYTQAIEALFSVSYTAKSP
jgi:hypothetical protein